MAKDTRDSKDKETRNAPQPEENGAAFEAVFAALEEKVEKLSGRVKELSSENARLKAAVVETVADRDRLKKEIEDLREVTGGGTGRRSSPGEAERSG
jgi:septal ring factor EnvC (AmiA/AmiB activator)